MTAARAAGRGSRFGPRAPGPGPRRFVTCTTVVLISVPMLARPVLAQSAFPAGRFEAGVTLAWTTETDLGSRSATLTRNSPSDSSPFTLFSTSARIEPAPALAANVGYRLTEWLTAEASGRTRRPDVAVAIRSDAEGAADRTITGERLTEYAIDASALVAVPIRVGTRVWPFAMAGAGYRRDVHADSAKVDSGTSIHAGGGVKWLFTTRPKGWLRGLGGRAEVRVTQRRGGFHLDRATSVSASAGGGMFLVF